MKKQNTKIYIIQKLEIGYYEEIKKSIWFASQNKQESLNAIDYYGKTHNIKDMYDCNNNRETLGNLLLWELYECNQYSVKKILTNYED